MSAIDSEALLKDTIPIAKKLQTESDLVFSINSSGRRNSQDALFEEPVS